MLDAYSATPEDIQEITDGEVLDLIYQLIEDDILEAPEMVATIKRILGAK